MTTLNMNTLASKQLSQVIQQLNDMDTQTVIDIYNTYADENSYEKIYDNDEFSINVCFETIHEGIKAAIYGDYTVQDSYFTFNGCANLITFNNVIDENCPIDYNELAQWIVDNELFDDYDIEVTTLLDMKDAIEDNINGDKYTLAKLADYLGQSLNADKAELLKTDDNYYEYLVSHLMNEIDDYDCADLYDLINAVDIDY